jgi:hypothetical protein
MPVDLVGISCIAEGADSLFAEAAPDVGGRLTPHHHPPTGLPPEEGQGRPRRPLQPARPSHREVLVLPNDTADRRAYEAANAVLLQRADRLVAVWDGTPPGRKGGGTADTVEEARAVGIPVDVVWPDGAARRSAE